MSEFTQIKEKMNEVRETLLKWLKQTTDFPVVMSDHSDTRPDGPHITFKLLTTLIKIGSFDENVRQLSQTGVPTGKRVLRADRELTIAIEAVGDPVGPDDDLEDMIRATDILSVAHLSLDKESVRALFDSKDIAIVSEGNVTDISQLLETETEPRALLEIVLRIRLDFIDAPGYFDTVQFTGDFDTDCDGNFGDISTGIIQIP